MGDFVSGLGIKRRKRGRQNCHQHNAALATSQQIATMSGTEDRCQPEHGRGKQTSTSGVEVRKTYQFPSGRLVGKFWRRMSGSQHEFPVHNCVCDCCVATEHLTDWRPRKGGWKRGGGLGICDVFTQLGMGDQELLASRFMFTKHMASSTSPTQPPSTSASKFLKIPTHSCLTQALSHKGPECCVCNTLKVYGYRNTKRDGGFCGFVARLPKW